MFDAQLAKTYEAFFRQNHSSSFEILDGRRGVMLSAPHSVEQTREGRVKYAEPQTGVLARLLHDELDCPVIYKTRNCEDDANYDEFSTYKEALLRYIPFAHVSFLIDLHQMSPARELMINLGTGNFKNIRDKKYIDMALTAFTRREMGRIQVGAPFDATYPYTISSFISSRCHIPCLQIEINSGLLWEEGDGRLADVYDALRELILSIEGEN